ncbi:MAG: ABC transporter ATP-binding protein [Candidatus Babeliales bacterium]|jgi:ABC-2 type transport system ATP-binding protein
MNSVILRINDVTKIYHTKQHIVHALDNINLDIYRGEIFGLLGVNGAGKTTLSSILATLHPPTRGNIFFNEKSIYSHLMDYRKSLGFCPQQQNLDQFLTVEENLIFAGKYFLMSKQDIEKRVTYLLDQFELNRYASFNINELSGGNKQRLLIARALIHNPDVVILDEPTVGLDPDIRRKLWQYIRDLKQMGITIILTTHYLDEAEYLSDRICVLHKGKVVLIESMKNLKEHREKEKLEDIFLEILEKQNEQ